MVVKNTSIHDSSNNVDAQNSNYSSLDLDLNSYNVQFSNVDVTTSSSIPNSESFDLFTLNPYQFGTENSDGSLTTLTPDPSIASNPLPIRLTTFPGRDSILPVFVDNSMFTDTGGTVSYNSDGEFSAINMPNGKIYGFMSDFVQFSIGTHYWLGGSSNPLPTLVNSTGNGTATHFYLSGDAYAFSDDKIYDQAWPKGTTVPSYINTSSPPSGFQIGDGVSGVSGTFEELTLNATTPYDGYMAQPNTPPPTGNSTPFPTANFPGTYDLLQANPTDITGISKIVSTYGRWRNIESMAGLSNTTFDILVFPNSSDLFTENTPADAVGFSHQVTSYGVVVTNLYVGYAFFTGNGSDTPVCRLYPLNQFIQGSTTGEIDYDLTKLTTASGASSSDNRSIRNGTYTYNKSESGGDALPAGFLSTGTFAVFRY
jgi:hypothetical protein